MYKCSSRYAKSSILNIIGYICSLFLNNCKSVGISSYLSKVYFSRLSLIVTKAVFFALLLFLSSFLISKLVYSQQVTCNGLPATLVGTEGDDVIDGTNNPDVISGLGGNDIINGLGGDDTICGGDGADTINGGDGKDTIFGENGSDLINGDNGLDNLDGGEGDDVINGGEGNDIVKGQAGNDTLRGNEGDDNIEGNGGEDLIEGNTGKDTINGGDGNDYIDGGEGDDLLEGGNGDDEINGGAGKDDIFGQLGNDILRGNENDDYIEGNEGDDLLEGNGGKDTLHGGPNNDTIIAGDGNDTLNGGANIDTLDGGLGKNTCIDGEFNTNCDTETGGETDLTPPTISIDSPSEPIINVATLQIIVSYSDPSGIDTKFVKILVDTQDITSRCTINITQATCTSPALSEGQHTITAEVRDIPGNSATDSFTFEVDPVPDTIPPTIEIISPNELIITNSDIQVVIDYTDENSGIDINTLIVLFDNNDITASCAIDNTSSTCQLSSLAEDIHSITAEISDISGNQNRADFSFIIEFDGIIEEQLPVIENLTPVNGTITNNSTLLVGGTVTDDSGVNSVLVNGQQASISGNTFSLSLTLNEGFNLIEIEAIDDQGNKSVGSTGAILDTVPAVISITSPVIAITNFESIQIVGNVVDEFGIDTVEINGLPVILTDNKFDVTQQLQVGVNIIDVTATDFAGNISSLVKEVIYSPVPQLTITEPLNSSLVNTETIQVAGTISDPDTTIVVNGISASVSGNTFTADNIPLSEGSNTITAVATGLNNNVNTASISVIKDTTAPSIGIELPEDGSVVNTQTISVTGNIVDVGKGIVNDEVLVTVNGIAADVMNGNFMVEDILLSLGPNLITVSVVDELGNTSSESVNVTFEDITNESRIELVSGNNQFSTIGNQLADPLIVKLFDSTGNPITNAPVVFEILQNNGTLQSNTTTDRIINTTTDTQGNAEVQLTLGTRAGSGNNVVSATAPGLSGEIIFTATGLLSTPDKINVDSGFGLTGVVGNELPQSYTVVITDSGHNRIPDVPVTFTVKEGEGNFGGQTEITINTDSEGKASARLILGQESGIANNIIEATFTNNPGRPSTFVSSSKIAGDKDNTTIKGVVLDNSNIPIQGVSILIDGTTISTVTDQQGQFFITQAPVGDVKLIADGTTAQRPGT